MDTLTVAADAGLAGKVGDALCRFTRPAMLEVVDEKSCVLATRIALDVFDYFGIAATPLPVYAQAFSPGFVATAAAGGDHYDPATCRLVQIEFHLVAYLPAEHALLDLSIDQASRPSHGLNLGPLFVLCPPNFDPAGGAFALGNPDGAAIEYATVLRQPAPAWRRAPDWTDKARRRPLVAATIRHLTR